MNTEKTKDLIEVATEEMGLKMYQGEG